jgi:hypothetical protein
LFSQEIHDLDNAVANLVLENLGTDFSFPAMIKRRNMGRDKFPAPYPYRDDAELIWNAILPWVWFYFDFRCISILGQRLSANLLWQGCGNTAKEHQGGLRTPK